MSEPFGSDDDLQEHGPSSEEPGIFAELKRRRVYRVGAAYLAIVLAGLQSADVIFPALGLGPRVVNAAVVLGLLGFPLAIALAWIFDVRDGGIHRTGPALPGEVPFGTNDRWERAKAALVGAGFVVVVWFGVRLWQPTASADPSPVPTDVPTLAVLPLDDLSPSAEYAYLAAGLHEEILHQLAHTGGLQLTSRTSSSLMRGLPASVAADSLGVRYVLEGSLRFSGDSLLLTVQLIDALDDVHVWSDAITRGYDLNGLLEIQRVLAQGVSVALRGTLVAGRSAAGNEPPTSSLAAYNELLRGLHAESRFDLNSLWDALGHYRRAVELDPEFGRAHAKVTHLLAVLNNYGGVEQGAFFPEIREHAELALRYAPEDPDALLAQQALIWPITRDWPEALRVYREILDRYPDNVMALWGLAEWYGVIAGDSERALDLLRRAEALDPLSPTIQTVRGWVLYNNRDFEGCAREYDRVLDMNPLAVNAAIQIATCRARLGDLAAGQAALDRARALLGDAPDLTFAAAAAEMGEAETARDILGRVLDLKSSGGNVSAAQVAGVYAALGDVEPALEWLERSFRDEGGIYYLRNPGWDRVAAQDRFQALWDETGLMGEHPSLEAAAD